METVVPSVSDSYTLSVIPLQLTIAIQLMHFQQHSTILVSVRLHCLCISSRIQLILFAPHDNCIRLRFGWPNTHRLVHTQTHAHTHTLSISQLDTQFHAFMQGQFQINLRSFEFSQKPKCKPSVIIQWSWAHRTVGYICMATLYVTVCGVDCEQEMYASGAVGFFCLSNSLCLLGYLGKAHLIAAQWAEMANKRQYL